MSATHQLLSGFYLEQSSSSTIQLRGSFRGLQLGPNGEISDYIPSIYAEAEDTLLATGRLVIGSKFVKLLNSNAKCKVALIPKSDQSFELMTTCAGDSTPSTVQTFLRVTEGHFFEVLHNWRNYPTERQSPELSYGKLVRAADAFLHGPLDTISQNRGSKILESGGVNEI